MADRLDYDFTVADRGGTSTLAKGAAGMRDLDRAGDQVRRGSMQLAEAQLKVKAAMVQVGREEDRLTVARRKLDAVTKDSTASDDKRTKALRDVQSAEVRHAQSLLRVQQAGEGAARTARDTAAATEDTGRASRRAADDTDDSARRHTRAFGAIRVGARGMAVGVGVAMGGVGIAMAAAAGGALLLVGQVKGWLTEARDAEKVGRLTAAAIRSTGGAANVTAKQVGDYAEALSNKIGVDDEAIQSASNLLLTFTKVRNETGRGNDIFRRATGAIVDMTAAMNNGEVTEEKMRGTTVQLGKALNDPIKGVTALGRAGVMFTKQQREQIETMVKSGNILGAQKMILAELSTQFGGAAAAGADAGKRLSTVWGNFKETLGTALLPSFNTAADWLSERLPAAATAGAAKLRQWGPTAFGWWRENWPGLAGGMVTVARVALGMTTAFAGVAAAGLYTASALAFVGAAAAYVTGNIDQGVKLQLMAKGLSDSAGKAIEFGNAIQSKTNPMLDAMQGKLDAARRAAAKLPASKTIFTSAPGATRSAAQINGVRIQLARVPPSKRVDLDVRTNAASVVAVVRAQLNSIKDSTTYHTTVLRTVRAMQANPAGGYASGTDSARPGMAWVGEAGAELVDFSGGERVYTAGQSARMASAGLAPDRGYAAGTGALDPASRWSGAGWPAAGRPGGGDAAVVQLNIDGQAFMRWLVPALLVEERRGGPIAVSKGQRL